MPWLEKRGVRRVIDACPARASGQAVRVTVEGRRHDLALEYAVERLGVCRLLLG